MHCVRYVTFSEKSGNTITRSFVAGSFLKPGRFDLENNASLLLAGGSTSAGDRTDRLTSTTSDTRLSSNPLIELWIQVSRAVFIAARQAQANLYARR